MKIEQLEEDLKKSLNESYKTALTFLGENPEETYKASYIHKINQAANLLLQAKLLVSNKVGL